MNKQQTILVTGGAGYIGSITTKTLIDNGYLVVVLDSLENGHREAIDKRAIFEIANLADPDDTRAVFKKYQIDAVIDFAAYLIVGESMTEPFKYIKNNVLNFINLLDVMIEFDCKRLIKSSTAAVYGNPLDEDVIPLKESYTDVYQPKSSALLSGKINGVSIEGEEFFQKILEYLSVSDFIINNELIKLTEEELATLRIPTSVYGLTKSLDEILMKKYDELFGIKSIALRYFNVAGADPSGEIGEDHPLETHLIPKLIKNIVNKDKFEITGNDYDTKDGTPIRDYIHVNDLALGHTKALEYLLRYNHSEVFNLGTNSGYTVLEILKTVEQITGQKVNYNIAPRRSGDPAILLADSKKALDLLKWKTKYDLCDIVQTAYNWHHRYPDGYRSKAIKL